MKYQHLSNFPNYKNLMDMLIQTYNTFFGNKIYCFQLSCLNYKLGKDILSFQNLCCFWILFPCRPCRLFSLASKHRNRITSSQNKPKDQCLAHLLAQGFHVQMNRKPSPILSGTNLNPQLLEIQVEEVTQSQYKNICVQCYNQQPFKSTF